MDEESKPLTAFTVGPLGFYECKRMPFGLTISPTTFQRLMETCLWDFNLHWCIIYLDDKVILSKDLASHLERLEAVFQKLEEAWRYYCRFIPKFMQVAWPLHELTLGENAGKKKAAIKWDSRCQQAFDDLKQLCITVPILAYANFSKPFKLHTDVCGHRLRSCPLLNQGGWH